MREANVCESMSSTNTSCCILHITQTTPEKLLPKKVISAADIGGITRSTGKIEQSEVILSLRGSADG